MEEYEDLNEYNGDPEHDMWVDFDNYENTGIPMFSMRKKTTVDRSFSLMCCARESNSSIIRKTKRATLSERNVPKLKRNDSPSQNEAYL